MGEIIQTMGSLSGIQRFLLGLVAWIFYARIFIGRLMRRGLL